MENKDYVSLEIAKQLEQKGYERFNNELSRYGYYCYSPNSLREEDKYDFNYYTFTYAPHIYDVQKWLREKHKINIIIDDTGESMRYTYTINDMLNQYKHEGICESLEYNSYEECLNKAIGIVLTKMI